MRNEEEACFTGSFERWERDFNVKATLTTGSFLDAWDADDELEYEDLAKGLKAAMLDDRHCLTASALEHMTGTRLRGLLGWPRPLPLESERTRLLNEVGRELRLSFGGRAANLVRAAEGYACRLVKLLTTIPQSLKEQEVVFLRRPSFDMSLWREPCSAGGGPGVQ